MLKNALFISIFRGFAAKLLLEALAEIAGRGEARAFGDVAYAALSAAQHLGGTVQAYAAYEGHGGLLHQGGELLVQAGALHAEVGGQLLHAGRIGFTHPKTGKRMVFEAEPEERFLYWLNKLKCE